MKLKNFMILVAAGLLMSQTAIAQDSTSSDSTVPATTAPVEAVAPAPTTPAKPARERKGAMNVGGAITGYYDYSTRESLYITFTTDEVTAMGLGFKGFFEYGLAERFSFTGSVDYSFLLDANFNVAVVERNFYGFTATGNYYFTDYDSAFQPYISFGGGAVFSSKGIAPALAIGGGMHYMFSDEISLKAEVIGKSGIVFNRGEVALGVAYHF